MTPTLPYITQGESGAPAVMLIHRGGTLGSLWEPQLEALAKRFYVIVPDLFYPNDWGSLTITRAASDLLAVADDALPEGKPLVLVGIALGAVVATQIALDAPERVRGLVLGAPRVRVPARAMWLNRTIMRLLPRKMIETSHVRAARRSYDDLSDEAERDMYRVGRPGLLAASRAMEDTDFSDGLPTLNAPIRVLIGAHGTETARSAATVIARRAPNAHVHLLEDTGSALNQDHPETFNTAVIEFIDTLPEQKTGYLQR